MYDDRPSLITEGLLLGLAWLALYCLSPALANFWHMDRPAGAMLGAMALFAVCAARWPWCYSLLVPAGVLAWNQFGWLREGLRLDFAVWWLDLRLGFWPGPEGLLAWIFLGVVMLGLGLLFVREPLARGRAFWTVVTGTLLLGHMWLWGGNVALPQYGLFLLAAVPLWVAGAASHREYRWWRAGRRVVQPPHSVIPLLAAAALAGLVAWVLPSPERGLELGAVSAWARSTFPAMEAMRGNGDPSQAPGFTLAEAGFARRVGELGGPIRLSAGTAFSLRFLDGPPADTLYLRGTAMTRYTGRGWAPDTAEGDVGGDVPVLGREITMEVTPQGYRGATLFYPRELGAIRGVEYAQGREGQAVVTGPLPASYQVTAYLPTGRAVAAVLNVPYDPGRYLALPKSLPGRVGALTAQVTEGKSTAYAQAVAIEEYLRGFDYALTVPPTPPGRDFVDYYLFDLKRGYCAYSATAMVVMLRTQGIPARWVQGFVVPPGFSNVTVPWSDAHAWVEAYLPGHGWTLFDPTPRFPQPYRAAEPDPASAVVAEPDSSLGTDDASTGGQAGEVEQGARTERRIPWVPLLVALVAVGWLATQFRTYYRERIDWRNERAGLLRAFAMLSAALRRMGLGRRPHETPVEYARAVGSTWPDVGDALARIAPDVTAAQYAPPRAPAPPGARRRMGGALAAIWYQARRRFGVVRTVWIRLKYIWGKD